MARVVGGRRQRLGRESVLVATTVAAVLLGVVSVFVAIQLTRAGFGAILAVGPGGAYSVEVFGGSPGKRARPSPTAWLPI